jgi:hypothetical protein
MKRILLVWTVCLSLLLLGSSTALAQAPTGPEGMAQGRMMQKRMAEMLGAR